MSFSFRAGRCFRQGETNTVVAAPGRGLISIDEEDGLLHFRYKDLESSAVEDLILFPGDASWIKASDRVNCLKFSSSSARYFFWHQDPSSDKDAERSRRVNELIGAEVEEESGSTSAGAMDVEGSSPSSAAAPSTSTAVAPSTSDAMATPAPVPRAPPVAPGAPSKSVGPAEQLSQLQQILANIQGGQGSAGMGADVPPFLLTDILPLPVLQSLLASNPSLNETLLPFLPSDIPQDASSLQRAITSPEFKRSVASFDRALRTRALGPLVTGLSLEQDSAMGVEAFLQAIQRQADEQKRKEDAEKGSEGSSKMDTD